MSRLLSLAFVLTSLSGFASAQATSSARALESMGGPPSVKPISSLYDFEGIGKRRLVDYQNGKFILQDEKKKVSTYPRNKVSAKDRGWAFEQIEADKKLKKKASK